MPGKWPPFVVKYLPSLVGDWWSIMSGVASIPFAALEAFGPFSQKGLFLSLAFVALWIVIVRLFIRHYQLKERLTPKLSASGHANLDGCKIFVPLHGNEQDRFYFRILVTNNGDSPLTGCSAILHRISRNGVTLMSHEHRQLTFSPGHNDDATNKTIHGKTSAYLDVLIILARVAVIYLPTPREKTEPLMLNGGAVFTDNGKYVFAIDLVSNESVTVPVLVEFEWMGTGEASILSAVKLPQS